ncbi:MAG TPA: HAMP domain-containing sensor histidine kinase [Acidimicrobiia bacterium]|nr:HAMP domain-containing sensor histidine kinase [Acidimicrobiia bacterium]
MSSTGTASPAAPTRRRLRFRVIASFTIGGLALAVSLSVVTYVLAQRYLLVQRERTALRQAYFDARTVIGGLGRDDANPRRVLRSLELDEGKAALLVVDGTDVATSEPDLLLEGIPAGLRKVVERGVTATQRVERQHTLALVVGVPFGGGSGAALYQIFPLRELRATLRVIRGSLLLSAAISAAAAAALGMWASRRVLRPVNDVADAATRIAGGDLTARLDAQPDPDLDRVADAFNTMVDAVAHRIDREAQFASDVSHELRSPLTTLASSGTVLEAHRDELAAPAREALDLVLGEIGQFQLVVEELLELSRAEAGVDPLLPESVRVAELVLNVAARFRGAEFDVDVDPATAGEEILLDKRRIERVLVNLLINAETHGGGISAVRVRRVDDRLRIVVEDKGPGVPEEDRERIFERFFRGASSGRRAQTSGTGLGLAIVDLHVRVHGGSITAETGPDGVGSRFVIELPWNTP